MAYEKKLNYPSIKKPGVYPSGSVKKLGLDNVNLEKFSLGNWEEYKRNDVQVLNPYDLGTSEDVTTLPDFKLEDLNSQDLDLADINYEGIFVDENLKVNVQSMRYSPDGTKLFVLTRESEGAIAAKIHNETVGITGDDIFTAKHILTYNLDTPYIVTEGVQLVSIDNFGQANYPFLNQTIVDFHISPNRIIFLSQNQPPGEYQIESFCQLNSFKLQNEFDIASHTYPVDWHPFVLSPESLDGVEIFNAKSFDIVENGTKLFILHGTSPLYQTNTDDATGTGASKWNYRINNDVDYLTGFSMSTGEFGESDIRSLSIIPGNQREIFKKNPERIDNQSNNLRFIEVFDYGGDVDWSGLATVTSVPPPFEGDPLSNPIFMSDEPWFSERKSLGSYIRELGAICPRSIRFHPTKQKMFIYGMVVNMRFQDAEKNATDDSWREPGSKNYSFLGNIFQYDFNYNYDIENSYFKSSKDIGFNFGTTNGWSPKIEFFGFDLAFYDQDVDPKVSFLISKYEEEPNRLDIQQIINQMVVIEEENLEVYNFLFVNQDSEFYQKFQSLINIPPNTDDDLFAPPTDETFEVHTFTNNTDLSTISMGDVYDKSSFIYHDPISDNYTNTSYPVKVFLGMNLLNSTTGDDTVDLSFMGTPLITQWLQQSLPNEGTSFDISNITSNDSNFYFKVIQWGDEKNLLTNEQIINSEYFVNYDEDSDLYKYKRFFYTLKDFIPMRPNSNEMNLISHVYNEPGVKSIKIIVTRFSKNNQWVIETSLITKNIVVNDGNLLSQDFSIFGGTDFNFLPITDNQAIIGGLDGDSNYNNSVSKIVKDDNFVQEDYLERVSSRDYIQKFNNGLLGNTPSQLDLSQTRVFTEPRDIYDFIGGNRLEWINQGSGSLPINSLATDIFIRDDECVVDLNPANSEFKTIQNQMGTKEQGILIGDYKVNQPQGGRVQKQGVMKTPLLEKSNDKQAF